MITDTELKLKGIQILAQNLGDVETERFIALIQRERFDYTTWRQQQSWIDDLDIEQISHRAATLRQKQSQ